MTEIRVLVVHLPQMLREIVVKALDDQPELRVVGELTGEEAELISVLAGERIDVVVSGADDPGITALLGFRPARPIVLIGADGRDGFICRPSGELSVDALVAAVRATAR